MHSMKSNGLSKKCRKPQSRWPPPRTASPVQFPGGPMEGWRMQCRWSEDSKTGLAVMLWPSGSRRETGPEWDSDLSKNTQPARGRAGQ